MENAREFLFKNHFVECMVQDEGLEWGVFAERWQHQLFCGKADLLSIVEARGGGTEKKRLMTRGWKSGEAKQGCR